MLSENTRQDRKTEGIFIAQTVSKFVPFDKMRMDGGYPEGSMDRIYGCDEVFGQDLQERKDLRMC